ncbi:erythrocyte binding protein [Pelomyxa schiedti]|nr:erythrocyte binding protein [Pelomyxa schiedti]
MHQQMMLQQHQQRQNIMPGSPEAAATAVAQAQAQVQALFLLQQQQQQQQAMLLQQQMMMLQNNSYGVDSGAFSNYSNYNSSSSPLGPQSPPSSNSFGPPNSAFLSSVGPPPSVSSAYGRPTMNYRRTANGSPLLSIRLVPMVPQPMPNSPPSPGVLYPLHLKPTLPATNTILSPTMSTRNSTTIFQEKLSQYAQLTQIRNMQDVATTPTRIETPQASPKKQPAPKAVLPSNTPIAPAPVKSTPKSTTTEGKTKMSKKEVKAFDSTWLKSVKKLASDATVDFLPILTEIARQENHPLHQPIMTNLEECKKKILSIPKLGSVGAAPAVLDCVSNCTEKTVENFLEAYKDLRSAGIWLDDSIYEYTMEQLHSTLWPKYCRQYVDEDLNHSTKIRELPETTPAHLGIAPNFCLFDPGKGEKNADVSYASAIEAIHLISKKDSPTKKVDCLVKVGHEIANCIRNYWGQEKYSAGKFTLAADDFLPLFAFITIRSDPDHPYTASKYMEDFLRDDELTGERGYMLVTFQTCLAFIMELKTDEVLKNGAKAISAMSGFLLSELAPKETVGTSTTPSTIPVTNNTTVPSEEPLPLPNPPSTASPSNSPPVPHTPAPPSVPRIPSVNHKVTQSTSTSPSSSDANRHSHSLSSPSLGVHINLKGHKSPRGGPSAATSSWLSAHKKTDSPSSPSRAAHNVHFSQQRSAAAAAAESASSAADPSPDMFFSSTLPTHTYHPIITPPPIPAFQAPPPPPPSPPANLVRTNTPALLHPLSLQPPSSPPPPPPKHL